MNFKKTKIKFSNLTFNIIIKIFSKTIQKFFSFQSKHFTAGFLKKKKHALDSQNTNFFDIILFFSIIIPAGVVFLLEVEGVGE